MNLIRASVATRFFNCIEQLKFPALQSKVKVTSVSRAEYESASRSLRLGEVVSTSASSCNFPVADFIHVVAVKISGVIVGKLHLKFYRQQNKVKRTFVAMEMQVRKLLCKRSNRLALAMVDWTGDQSPEYIGQIASQSISEIERIASTASASSHPVAKAKDLKGNEVKPNHKKKPDSSAAAAASGKPYVSLKSAVERSAVGSVKRGIVVELGSIVRSGKEGQYMTFCLKIDDNGKHIPLYGVELERECYERRIEAGQFVEVVCMGRQTLEDGRTKNLYRITKLDN